MTWGYRDNNDGTFGSSGDMNSIYAAFAQMGVTMLPGGVAHAQKTLNEANSNCTAHSTRLTPDQAQCRVVAVGVMTGSLP